MSGVIDQRSFQQGIAQRLLAGPVEVRADELSFPLQRWRAIVREAASELGRPVTVYATTDASWAALVEHD